MHVQNLSISVHVPFPKNRGSKTTFFQRLRNLMANLTAYIFGTKHDIHNRATALETTRGLLHRVKMSRTLAHKRLKIGPKFLPTLRKFCIPLQRTIENVWGRWSLTSVMTWQSVDNDDDDDYDYDVEHQLIVPGTSTPCKRWSKCTMEKVGGRFLQELRGEVHKYALQNF